MTIKQQLQQLAKLRREHRNASDSQKLVLIVEIEQLGKEIGWRLFEKYEVKQ